MSNKFLWLLDNGHGKETPGKRSPKLNDGRRLFEFEFNRNIVKRIAAKLKEAGINYEILIPEVKGDVSLRERVRRANDIQSLFPKLFISVHANAHGNGKKWTPASGLETYYFRSSLKGRRLASLFQEKLVESIGWKDRGVKAAGFYVIKYTDMPAILTENGFYTNKEECKKMLSGVWRNRIAEAHFKAIMEIENKGLKFFRK